MNDVIQIIQALENSNILLKGVTETKEEKKRIFKYIIRYFRS